MEDFSSINRGCINRQRQFSYVLYALIMKIEIQNRIIKILSFVDSFPSKDLILLCSEFDPNAVKEEIFNLLYEGKIDLTPDRRFKLRTFNE
jgi:hypothetical protein